MLLVHAPGQARSRYSHYLAELVRLEGFTDVVEVDLDALSDAVLAARDLVVLPRVALTAAQADLLVDYVSTGGKAILLQPDPVLAQRLGLDPTYRTVANGYLAVSTTQPTVAGLCPEPVQVVVPATGWQPAAGVSVAVLAELRAGDNPMDMAPGVVRVAVGNGEAIVVAYDLAHAVARLRQGDPAFADLSSAGLDGFYRPHELFVRQLPLRQQALPQADIQTALLARLIETLRPQPRVWYYPEADQRSALVMTSDDDWSTIEQFETLLTALERRRGTCSFYIVPGTNVTSALMTDWERAGHAFSVHPALDADYGDGPARRQPQPVFVAAMIRDNVARHQREFDRPVRTIRNHAVRWSGYLDPARTLAALEVGMECNYVSVPPLTLGYLAGSGRALRFVDADGTVINCYQQPTLWTEECLVHPSHPAGAQWNIARAVRETTAVIQGAARTFYTPVTINSHPVSFATYSSPLIEANWDAARAKGMPIISADRWLDWTEVRERLRLTPRGADWTLRSGVTADAATLLFPEGTSPDATRAERTRQVLWGRTYDVLTVRDLTAGEERRITTGASVAGAGTAG